MFSLEKYLERGSENKKLISTMFQDLLINLSIMCTQSDIHQKIDFEELVEDFTQNQ